MIQLHNFNDQFYFENQQILSYGGHFFWLQNRYEDSFGSNFIGQFIVDTNGNERQTNPALASYRFTCEQLLKGTTS
jgi:hypothetical protein